MTSVDIFKASRMKQIEDTTVVGGLVDTDGHLLLKTRANQTIDAGNVVGPQGLGFRARGAWAATTPYLKNDVVTANGSTYVVTTAHTSGTTAPTPAAPGPNLTLWAIKGTDGTVGKDGDPAVPAGTVTMWTSDTVPTNWLVCNGQAVSRSAYPSLFDAIGTKYGAGDGVNTFNLPSLHGRAPVGIDPSQTEFNALGKTGGAKTHLLTAAESGLPAHNHLQDAHGHILRNGTSNLDYWGLGGGGLGGWSLASGTSNNNIYRQTLESATATNQPNAAANASQAHNNLQPYTVVQFIIKATAGTTPGDSELAQRLSALEAQFSATPAGTITGWGGSTAPANWLLCDGSAVSRTLYASLFSAIGIQYGSGDGSTTFNVPNLKGRVPVGRDSAQTEFDVLGETGGAKTHTLTVTEMPSHDHGGLTGAGNPAAYRLVKGVGGGRARNHATGWDGGPGYTDYNDQEWPMSAHNHNITAQGGGGAHNNVQPYQVINYIIKTTNGDVKTDSQLTNRVSALESGSFLGSAIREKTKRAQASLHGGGRRKVGDGNFSFVGFDTMGIGRDALAPVGRFTISMPPDGTVIPVFGHTSVTSVTVGSLIAGRISVNSISGYCALYYELPIGSNTSASDPTRFKLVDYLAGPFTIPDNWVLIMVRTVNAHAPEWKWGDGRAQDWWRPLGLINGWVNYGGGFSVAAWKRTGDGEIVVKGLIASGSATYLASADANRPGPEKQALFLTHCNGGTVRIDVITDGSIMIATYDRGNNAFVSLEGIRWYSSDV